MILQGLTEVELTMKVSGGKTHETMDRKGKITDGFTSEKKKCKGSITDKFSCILSEQNLVGEALLRG